MHQHSTIFYLYCEFQLVQLSVWRYIDSTVMRETLASITYVRMRQTGLYRLSAFGRGLRGMGHKLEILNVSVKMKSAYHDPLRVL